MIDVYFAIVAKPVSQALIGALPAVEPLFHEFNDNMQDYLPKKFAPKRVTNMP